MSWSVMLIFTQIKSTTMGFLGDLKNRFYTKLRRTLNLEQIDSKLNRINMLQVEDYLQTHLYNNPRYNQPDKLNRFEFQAFSQVGDDGIIEEIFKRIGVTNQYFIEFGVEDGTETNSTYLLYKGWKGLWMDGSEANIKAIHQHCSKAIARGDLKAIQAFITAENIEFLFQQAGVPTEPDLLSIDIDRNDLYVWKAINQYKPRVVIVEYNAVFRPGCEFVVDYDAAAMWDGSSNTGASLDAFCKLGESKGYKLVGCCFAGVNAYFVREDLISSHFTGPFTAENHYEPPRYHLYTKPGHPRKISL
ncbi:MAG: hypothetical protein ACK4S0_06520 [Sediminibacterium sp.]|nr:hypothetical protein [uncultured Sediminibacterium sp.]